VTENEHGDFSPLEVELGRFLTRRFGTPPALALAAQLVNSHYRRGNTGVPLPDLQTGLNALGVQEELLPLLSSSPAVGRQKERRPLTWDGENLALTRVWAQEARVAAQILARTQPVPTDSKVLELAQTILGTSAATQGTALQAAGVLLPFFFRLAIVSGGPGTGKTTILAKLLALQIAYAQRGKKPLPRIALAAPTGKAAQRMGDALKKACENLPETLRAPLLELSPQTLHRLLGLSGPLSAPRWNAERPLNADFVVIDEASMLDLTLMDHLLSALDAQTHLVLLGDRDQLPSVDPGRLLADLGEYFSANQFSPEFCHLVAQVSPGTTPLPQGDALSPLLSLSHSYRFDAEQPLGRFARAVRGGNPQECHDILVNADGEPGKSRVELHPYDKESLLHNALAQGWETFGKAQTPEEALTALSRFMILCLTNEGPRGQLSLNQTLMKTRQQGGFWPVLITENSLEQNLFNGDLGVMRNTDNSERAYFLAANGSPRVLLRHQLPEHVPAFAMTVHKSQGSEFDRVALLLPEGENYPEVLGRELLYTAVTRARSQVEIWGSFHALESAVLRHTPRRSGLVKLLRERSR
jgi:exodeoxyribonuclease V alpha subunit